MRCLNTTQGCISTHGALYVLGIDLYDRQELNF